MPTNRSGQVRLTWLAPTSNGGSAVTDYVVQRSPNGTTGWATISDGVNTNTAYTATGLVNGTRYYFRVFAHNAAGNSPVSNVANAIPRTVPGYVSLRTVVASFEGFDFFWGDPVSTGGSPITGFVLQAYDYDTGSWFTVGTVSNPTWRDGVPRRPRGRVRDLPTGGQERRRYRSVPRTGHRLLPVDAPSVSGRTTSAVVLPDTDRRAASPRDRLTTGPQPPTRTIAVRGERHARESQRSRREGTMNARQLGALSVTLGAMAMAVGGFGFGVRALEGGALSPVKTTPVPEPPVSSSSLATPTTTTVSAPATPTSSPYVPLYPGVVDAVELAVSVSFPGLSISGIESRCFDTTVATATVADPDVGAAVDELTADARRGGRPTARSANGS